MLLKLLMERERHCCNNITPYMHFFKANIIENRIRNLNSVIPVEMVFGRRVNHYSPIVLLYYHMKKYDGVKVNMIYGKLMRVTLFHIECRCESMEEGTNVSLGAILVTEIDSNQHALCIAFRPVSFIGFC